eukprot:5831197-Pyramimonas_sp.AAC.1
MAFQGPCILIVHLYDTGRLCSGDVHQGAICFSSGQPGFLRSARCAVSARGRGRSCCVPGALGSRLLASRAC